MAQERAVPSVGVSKDGNSKLSESWDNEFAFGTCRAFNARRDLLGTRVE